MKFTPAAIARIALAIAAIPLISALVACVITFCVAAFVISFVVSWLHESDKKLHWSLLAAAWASTIVIIQQVLAWVKAPAEVLKAFDWFEAETHTFQSLD